MSGRFNKELLDAYENAPRSAASTIRKRLRNARGKTLAQARREDKTLQIKRLEARCRRFLVGTIFSFLFAAAVVPVGLALSQGISWEPVGVIAGLLVAVLMRDQYDAARADVVRARGASPRPNR